MSPTLRFGSGKTESGMGLRESGLSGLRKTTTLSTVLWSHSSMPSRGYVQTSCFKISNGGVETTAITAERNEGVLREMRLQILLQNNPKHAFSKY